MITCATGVSNPSPLTMVQVHEFLASGVNFCSHVSIYLAMFIAVRHGADEQKLFNPDCFLCLLVDNIRKRCQCSSNATLALLDEKWNIIHLSPHSMENGSSLFSDRAVYILLTIEKSENGVKYISLLENTDPVLIEFLSNPKASKPQADIGAAKNWGKLRKKIRQNTLKAKKTNSTAILLKGK